MGKARVLLAVLWMALMVCFGCGVKGKPVPKERVVPNAPSEFRVEVFPEGVRLSWRLPDKNVDGSVLKDLEAVEIWRADLGEPGCPGCPAQFRKVAEVLHTVKEEAEGVLGAMEYLDRDLTSGLYRYRLAARNSRGFAGRQSPVREIYWDVPPEAVRGVQVGVGDRRVELTWQPVTRLSDGTPVSQAEVSYQVFRGYKGRGFGASPLNEEWLREPRFVDQAVQNNMAYQYRVRAVREVKGRVVPGPFSSAAEATPRRLSPPEPPRGVVAFSTASGIRLIWEGARGGEVTGYRVYKALSKEGPWELITDPPHYAVVYEDRAVERGKWYWYSVSALDDAVPPNESARSEAVGIRFAPTPLPEPPEGKEGAAPTSR